MRYRINYHTLFANGSRSKPQTVAIEAPSTDAAVYEFHRLWQTSMGDTVPYSIDCISTETTAEAKRARRWDAARI